MKKVLIGLVALSSVSAFADCKVLDDTLNTKLSNKARQEIIHILSSKGYVTNFQGKATHVLRVIDIAQASYTSNDVLYGVDARLLGRSGGIVSRGTSVNVTQDEKFVVEGSWIDRFAVEAVQNLSNCEG